MTVFVAFLRAVNVGGTGIIKMADLKALCEKLGYGDVKTLLQSGNVVFTAKGKAAAIEKGLAAAIEKAHGFRPAVMVRTAAEMAAIVGANPFPNEAKADGRFVVVAFAAGPPTSGAGERIKAVKVVRERLKLIGRELFIHFPDGQGRSVVTNAALEKALGVPATARNWNTVTKLQAMAEAMEAGG
jgi:uncharacterized protein (DUF1697 family)